MFSLTHNERKVLLFIGILILCGATFKFFNVRVRSNTEFIPAQANTAKALPVNINSASQEELEIIPGIGPEIARRIIEYRNQVQVFKTLDDLDKVKGIGPAKLQVIKDYITF